LQAHGAVVGSGQVLASLSGGQSRPGLGVVLAQVPARSRSAAGFCWLWLRLFRLVKLSIDFLSISLVIVYLYS
jgi:hypothetical protein